MYSESVLVYRRLRLIRRFVLMIFTLALIGSISCFIYSEIRYGAMSMIIKAKDEREIREINKIEIANTDSRVSEIKTTKDPIKNDELPHKNNSPVPNGEEPDSSILLREQEKEERKKEKKEKKKKQARFSEALFIGNSITEGFSRWGDMKEATFYSLEGLNVNSYFNTDKFKLNNRTITPDAAVSEGKFDKVFLMFGINELGWRSKEAFINRYEDVIESVKKKQPSATIYVQSIIYVTEKKSATDKIFNNQNIIELNSKIKKMAKENEVEYIDLNLGLCGDKKHLPSEASTDGIHLSPKYCKKWKAYLVEYFNS